MAFKEVNIKDLDENFIKLVSDEWMLVAAGNEDNYNMMTASWGYFGEMWGKDTAVTVIRPQRYTKEFIDNEEYFSLSFYGDNKDIHKICGKKSGRDTDKAKGSGLTPVFDNNTVYFEQARLVVICKKIYCQKIEPECFVDKSIIDKWYDDDFHYAYVGEIEKVLIKE
ncbi:MAG: flavin reductase family protein [Acutalibacteraceae bacterium]|nr:flavin reductase family protein [Acutalibacteraceae bacterium]